MIFINKYDTCTVFIKPLRMHRLMQDQVRSCAVHVVHLLISLHQYPSGAQMSPLDTVNHPIIRLWINQQKPLCESAFPLHIIINYKLLTCYKPDRGKKRFGA